MPSKNHLIFSVIAALLWASVPAYASEDKTCTALVNGDVIEVDYSLFYE